MTRACRIVLAVALIALALPPAAPARARLSTLRVEAPHIVDRQGRIVILHGVNVVYKRPPYHPDARDDAPFAKSFNLADMRMLRSWGFNTIRYGLTWKGLEPERGTFDERYIDEVVRQIRVAERAGLYVLVDMHQDYYAEEFGGNGAPSWAVLDDGLRATYPVPPPFPFGYGHPAIGRAETSFWENRDGIRSEYVKAFTRVARRLAGDSRILGYDTYNEPLCEVSHSDCQYLGALSTAGPKPESVDKWLRPFHDELVPALQRADPSHIVFYEDWVTANFGFPQYMGRPPNKPWGYRNTGLSYHDYCGFPPFRLDPCERQDRDVFEESRRSAQRNDVAPLLTEFGATNNNMINESIVELADEFGVGWQYWSYKTYDDPTTAATTTEGDPAAQAIVTDDGEVKRDKLRVLARVYPARIAGRGARWGFDAAHSTFELTYRPRGRAETLVSIPTTVHYPRGYRASVRGGRVVSQPGASPLRVRARRGAREVRVEVVPD